VRQEVGISRFEYHLAVQVEYPVRQVRAVAQAQVYIRMLQRPGQSLFAGGGFDAVRSWAQRAKCAWPHTQNAAQNGNMAVIRPVEKSVYVAANFARAGGIKAAVGHKEVPLCFHVQ